MKTIYFVTGNQGKIDTMNSFVKEFSDGIDFEMLKVDFVELKIDDSLKETALNKARTCSKLTGKDVVVSDTGLFIECLNGFPGTNTAFTLDKIGNAGILKLMKNRVDRKAFSRVCLAYVTVDGVEKTFSSESEFEIAEDEKGEFGFGWDKIAVASGERFSEHPNNEVKIFPYRDATRQLVEFLKNE